MPFFKQPLVHFLLIGVLLFVLFNALNPTTESTGDTIVVDNDALLEYAQYRNRAFNQEQAKAMLSHLSLEERHDLVRRLVREEALYREALAMGFDRGDYVIKQRLIQKIEYLSQGYQADSQSLDRRAVEDYFKAHTERYREPPTITFTHVFVDTAHRSDEESRQKAAAILRQLQGKDVQFSQAIGYGERFLYYTNYVERSVDFVASHFGDDFSRDVFSLDADSRWHGPIRSAHGYHLVMISGRDSGGVPSLDDIYARVAADAGQALLERRQEEAVAKIIARYKVIDKTTRGEGGDKVAKATVVQESPE